MTKSTRVTAALIALLVGAAFLGQWRYGRAAFGGPSLVFGMLAFGILNALFQAPGTTAVRAIAIGATLLVLLIPTGSSVISAVIAIWLLWPPAFMVAWALARKREPGTTAELSPPDAATRVARITVVAIIVAVAAASLFYRSLLGTGLQQSAALFVGIPALLAIVVVFGVSPRSAVGVACKAVTVGLLVSALFLGEGVVCVLMSAPLFYVVAIAIASTTDRLNRRNDGSSPTFFSYLVLLAIVPMSMEGVTSVTTLNRDESVAESRIVHAPAAAVERALFEPPRFNRLRPRYLRAGFPSPVSARIEQQSGQPLWVIQVRGGEMRLDGMEPRTGELTLTLEDARPGRVRWRAVSDTSHTTHFLDWRESIVEWEAIDAQTTRVTWTLTYRRGLDPSWYFGPWERYAVRLSARYLIDAVATP